MIHLEVEKQQPPERVSEIRYPSTGQLPPRNLPNNAILTILLSIEVFRILCVRHVDVGPEINTYGASVRGTGCEQPVSACAMT